MQRIGSVKWFVFQVEYTTSMVRIRYEYSYQKGGFYMAIATSSPARQSHGIRAFFVQ
ncbi:MAG TPA: hypothetical protein GX710_07710 [Clostridiales bacterium]|nr:hypothetical protein [Clostridiales bacterium]